MRTVEKIRNEINQIENELNKQIKQHKTKISKIKVELSGKKRKLQKELKKAVLKESYGFELIKEFILQVPCEYDHDTALKSVPFNDNCCEFNWGMKDRYFKRASNQLIPGKSYRIRIFDRAKVCGRFSTQDALNFLKSQKALLVSAQGLAILLRTNKGIPNGKIVLSFDLAENLPTDTVIHFDFEEYNYHQSLSHDTKIEEERKKRFALFQEQYGSAMVPWAGYGPNCLMFKMEAYETMWENDCSLLCVNEL